MEKFLSYKNYSIIYFHKNDIVDILNVVSKYYILMTNKINFPIANIFILKAKLFYDLKRVDVRVYNG